MIEGWKIVKQYSSKEEWLIHMEDFCPKGLGYAINPLSGNKRCAHCGELVPKEILLVAELHGNVTYPRRRHL